MNLETLAEELRGEHVEDSLWNASCRLEELRKRVESEVVQEELFGFEQRLDILLGDIKEYALWVAEGDE